MSEFGFDGLYLCKINVLSEKCIDFKYKIINNAFFLTKIAPVWQVELMLGYEFIYLRLAFEGLYLWNKKCLGPLACGFVRKLRVFFFEWT